MGCIRGDREMTLEQIGLKITEVANDVKWLVKENKVRNGSFDDHIKESDKFRHRVTRNTGWRIAHHFAFTLVFGLILFIAYYIFK